MERRQILQKLFGDQSEEEDASLKEDSNHQGEPVFDGGLEHENEGEIENKGEAESNRRASPKVVHHDYPGSSRSPNNEKCKDAVAILQDVFGDSDNEMNEEIISPQYIGACPEGSHVKNVEPDEYKTYESDEECTETEVLPFDVFEIPLRRPPAASEQMATMRFSNLIGVDPNPFDPLSYDEDDIYVTDETGLKRCILHTNIIRWREVKNPDGTISAESNSRFVTWSDGSMQLLIGNEAFDISEQNANDLQSQLFLKHGKGIYQAQGKIRRKMKFMPSSISSKSHRDLTAMVQSRNKKVNKVRQYTPETDPERMVEQIEQVEKQTSRASKKLEKKKKKIAHKYKTMGRKERELTPGFLEDDEDHEQKLNELPTTMHQLDLDLENEAKAEKRIMNAKKGKKVVANSGEGAEPYEDSDVEVDAERSKPKGKSKQYIESDEDTPPRKTAGRGRRQLNISYDANDE